MTLNGRIINDGGLINKQMGLQLITVIAKVMLLHFQLSGGAGKLKIVHKYASLPLY